jgi:hypothetical protein
VSGSGKFDTAGTDSAESDPAGPDNGESDPAGPDNGESDTGEPDTGERPRIGEDEKAELFATWRAAFRSEKIYLNKWIEHYNKDDWHPGLTWRQLVRQAELSIPKLFFSPDESGSWIISFVSTFLLFFVH